MKTVILTAARTHFYEHFSFIFFHFSSSCSVFFLQFLLICKPFDVFVFFGQLKLTNLLATHEKMGTHLKILLICGVFVIK